ncbi:MAG: hypothetical protein WBM40_04610 [Thiohalocapsa sp.]
MKKRSLRTVSILALALGVSAEHAIALDVASPTVAAEAPSAESDSGYDSLLGWAYGCAPTAAT